VEEGLGTLGLGVQESAYLWWTAEIDMKKDLGKYALLVSLASWATVAIFTILSWWALSIGFSDHEAGAPRAETPLSTPFTFLAFLSYPMALAAVGLALTAFYKGQSMAKATFAFLIAGFLLAILSYGLWIAAHGGV